MAGFYLPKDLLLGAATAATQIEGGDLNCNWYEWSLQGMVGNGESSLSGADHYTRYREDIELMSSLGHECYRMSIEWSRIEPRKGEWSAEGIAHYRDEIGLILEKGIRPLVTLHHFSCPQWFQDEGGWIGPRAVMFYIRFCRKAVEELGDLVSEWCTINEPNVFAHDSYMDGKYPPGHTGDMRSYFKTGRNMVLAHQRAYRLIHSIRREKGFSGETMVGFAHHLACFEAGGRGLSHLVARLGTRLQNYLFHTIFSRGMIEGRLVFPLGRTRAKGKRRFCDFIGINYYSRHIIFPSFNPLKLFGTPGFDPQLAPEQKNDLGWEIYPEGLYTVCKECWDRYRLPIYITENGIPDAADKKRTVFLREHLRQVRRLLDAGVNVQRYYYWSLLDNLEWNDGYGPRFGLIEVDYAHRMERRVRESARFYETICRTKHVTEDSHADDED